MTQAYKIKSEHLSDKLIEYGALLGDKPMLPTFVEQTAKIVRKSPEAYLRFGPYWFAVKRILKAHGHDLGAFDVTWLANEYSIKSTNGVIDQESTLLAAWEFADLMETTFHAPNEWEIDGRMWSVEDEDRLSPAV